MKPAPAALTRAARARVYSRLFTTPPRPFGATNNRRRNVFQPWSVKMRSASRGCPSSRNVTPCRSRLARAEMSAPSMNGRGAVVVSASAIMGNASVSTTAIRPARATTRHRRAALTKTSDTPTHGSRLDAGRRCNLAKAPFVFATRGAAPLPSRTLRKPQPTKFVRVALVLPTEFAYARGVLRGIIAATRERNMYAGHTAPARRGEPPALPWLFRVYRGIYGHSSKYLGKWFRDWDPHGIIGQIYDDRLAKVYRDTGKPVVELFESRQTSEFPRVLPDDVATGEMAARHFLERG